MSTQNYDLLEEKIIPVRLMGGTITNFTLPEVLAALSSSEDRLEGFPGLRHHQQHPWFAFLVQLSAMALHRSGNSPPVEEPETWKQSLIHLAGGVREAYQLVVKDLSKPAFFQPPVPEGNLKKFKSAAETPDALDIVPTAKNHDLKAERICTPSPHHWFYSLITLQTMQGFYGAGNYGIVRMNGGFGNRPCVTFAPSLRWGPRFSRDLEILLNEENRESLIKDFGYHETNGHTLLWLADWDGAKGSSLNLSQCDPYFLEICRRIRLVQSNGKTEALGRPTKAARVDDGGSNGDVGDPWTPIDTKLEKALTLGGDGFSYSKTVQLMTFSDYRPGISGRPRPNDTLFLGRALIRGQGKTEGYHERVIRIPKKPRSFLFSKEGRDRLASMGKTRIEDTKNARLKVLKPALCSLFQGAPEKINYRDDDPDPWLRALEKDVDAVFFENLFEDIDKDEKAARLSWQNTLLELAKAQLEDAIESSPDSGARHYRAISSAESYFYGCAKKQFKDLFANTGEENNDETT